MVGPMVSDIEAGLEHTWEWTDKQATHMTHSAIVAKLKRLAAKGITTEAEALYLMVEVRKLLEQQQAKKQYEYLTFHCDWALHATLEGTTAQIARTH